MKNIPALKEVRSKINSLLAGKRRSSDKIVRDIAIKEQKTLSKYLTVIKAYHDGLSKMKKDTEKYAKAIDEQEEMVKEISKTVLGEGVRRYRQTRRNAYKVKDNGQYGGLMINIPRLMNEMVIDAHKGGQIVYEDKGDKSLIDLLTKRFNPKKRYSSKVIQIFNNLNMLSNMPRHRSSGKTNLIRGGMVIQSQPEDLMERLTLLTGIRIAGNTNISLRNEVWEILDHLLKLGVITKSQYDAYVKKHLI